MVTTHHQFDVMTKTLATGTTRRRAIAALGALALGSVGALALSQGVSADNRRQCIERCRDNVGGNVSDRDRRDRCRRKCENR